jgi:very-short-patch-repair endonuclease
MNAANKAKRPRAASISRARAKEMRRDPVYMEKMFWSYLRNRQLGGLKFRRQVAIGVTSRILFARIACSSSNSTEHFTHGARNMTRSAINS